MVQTSPIPQAAFVGGSGSNIPQKGDGEISLSQNTPNVRYGRLLVSTPPYIGLIESSKCTEYENNVSQVYN